MAIRLWILVMVTVGRSSTSTRNVNFRSVFIRNFFIEFRTAVQKRFLEFVYLVHLSIDAMQDKTIQSPQFLSVELIWLLINGFVNK